MIPWSPLARGRLARAPEAQTTPRSRDRPASASASTPRWRTPTRACSRALDAVAKARGLPHAQVALAWLLQKAGVTAPIVGATKMQHLDDAVAALAVKLASDEVRALEAPYVPHPVAGFG